MNKKYIEKMLDGIDDKYIAEAAKKPGNTNKSNRNSFTKIVAAASICLCIVGISATVLAATNTTFRRWINPFYAKEVKTEHGEGITITKEKENIQDTSKGISEEETSSQKYYLVLNYLPKGYKCEGDDTFLYHGPKGDTDFINIAYFHLHSDFTNILPQADKIEKYKTTAGTAYIASGKAANRVWILFHKGSYMMELRDDNKMLSKKEIHKIIDGTDISTEKPSVIYETLEWTEKLQESYKAWLKKYAE